MEITDKRVSRRALLSVPRTRGAVSGLLILLLGIWGALIPFLGPTFNYAFSPDQSWTWTAARGWLEVLPGAVAAVGGLLLLTSANRITASLGAWFAIAAGAWFVIGRDCAAFFHIGSIGAPTGSSNGTRLLESLGFFSGVGALVLFLASLALGRLSVRSARDLHAAERALQKQERHEAEIREDALAQARAEQDEAGRAEAAHAEDTVERGDGDRVDEHRIDGDRVSADRSTAGHQDVRVEQVPDTAPRPSAHESEVLERDATSTTRAVPTERVVAPDSTSQAGQHAAEIDDADTNVDGRGASRLGRR